MFGQRIIRGQFVALTIVLLFTIDFFGFKVCSQRSVDDLIRLHNSKGQSQNNQDNAQIGVKFGSRFGESDAPPMVTTVKPEIISREEEASANDKKDFFFPPTEKVAAPIYRTTTETEEQVFDVITHNILQLSHEIATNLAENYKEQTQVFSPLSIASAMSLLFLGSKGTTYDEFMSILGYNRNGLFQANPYKIHEAFGKLIKQLMSQEANNNNSGDKNNVDVANGIFITNKFSLRPTYKMAVESVYGGEIKALDFIGNETASRDYINKWAALKTHGKIKEIFTDEIDPKTRLLVVSSLYFLGFWESTFFESATRNETFYPNGKDNPGVTVEFMANGGIFPYYRSKEYGCEIIGIPYKKSEYFMYIILPINSSRDKLKQVQQTLNADRINEMISKMQNHEAVITIPKLDIKNSIHLKQIFQQKGLNSIFSEAVSDLSLMADSTAEVDLDSSSSTLFGDQSSLTTRFGSQPNQRFGSGQVLKVNHDLRNRLIFNRKRRQLPNERSAIQELDILRKTSLENPHLFADTILHKVRLTINERGTEGGAVTLSDVSRAVEVYFRATTPYIFLIRHESTKAPIFYGSVFEPTQSMSADAIPPE